MRNLDGNKFDSDSLSTLPPLTIWYPIVRTHTRADVGISFEKLVFAADEDTLLLPEEVRMRLGYFDIIAGAIDLSSGTFYRYMGALKVVKPTKAKSARRTTSGCG